MSIPPSFGKKDLQRENSSTCTGAAACWVLYKSIIWSWVSFCVWYHRHLKSCVCRKSSQFKKGGKKKKGYVRVSQQTRLSCTFSTMKPVTVGTGNISGEEQHSVCAVHANPLCIECGWRKLPCVNDQVCEFFFLYFFLSYLLWKKLLWKHKLSFHLKFSHNPVTPGFADLGKMCLLLWHLL